MEPGKIENHDQDLMHSTDRIQAVTFDVGGTLIAPWPSVGHVYSEVAAQNGFANIPPEELTGRFRQAWKRCVDFDYTRDGWEKLVNCAFDGLLPTPTTFFPALYDRFSEADAWHIFEDVMPSLDALASGGIQLGIISNWDDRLRPLLRKLNLHDCFEAVAISCEVGFCKPSPVIFEHAAFKLGLPPASILHIGDDLDNDVRGANAAGFRTLHLRRDAETDGAGEINSLAAIPAKIARPD
jgi:putative hydrolase of the HAD superfamily